MDILPREVLSGGQLIEDRFHQSRGCSVFPLISSLAISKKWAHRGLVARMDGWLVGWDWFVNNSDCRQWWIHPCAHGLPSGLWMGFGYKTWMYLSKPDTWADWWQVHCYGNPSSMQRTWSSQNGVTHTQVNKPDMELSLVELKVSDFFSMEKINWFRLNLLFESLAQKGALMWGNCRIEWKYQSLSYFQSEMIQNNLFITLAN